MRSIDPRIDPALVPVGSVAHVLNDRDKTYNDLPSVVTPNNRIITRWTLSAEERAAVAAGADVFVTLLSSGQINPFYVTIGPVDWRTTCSSSD